MIDASNDEAGSARIQVNGKGIKLPLTVSRYRHPIVPISAYVIFTSVIAFCVSLMIIAHPHMGLSLSGIYIGLWFVIFLFCVIYFLIVTIIYLISTHIYPVLFGVKDVLMIDADGFADRRVSEHKVPWSDVRKCEDSAFRGRRYGVSVRLKTRLPTYNRAHADIFLRRHVLKRQTDKFTVYTEWLDTKLDPLTFYGIFEHFCEKQLQSKTGGFR